MTTTDSTATAHPDVVELSDTQRDVVSRLAAIKEQLEPLLAEEKRLKAALRADLHAGQRGTVGGHAVVGVQPNRRFSDTLAAAVLPHPLLNQCTVKKIDGATAKKVLPPVLYEACLSEVGEPKVVLL